MSTLTPEQYEIEREKYQAERLELLKSLNLRIKTAMLRLDYETVKLSDIVAAIRLYNDHTRIEFRPLPSTEVEPAPIDATTGESDSKDPLATIKLRRLA